MTNRISSTMKPIQEVYSNSYLYDYQPMIDSMGYTILIQEDDRDYQGDTYILFHDGERLGILIFGWGSCSGCDALQACDSYADAEALRDKLLESILWHDGVEALGDYVESHDWEGDFMYHTDIGPQFLTRLKSWITAPFGQWRGMTR